MTALHPGVTIEDATAATPWTLKIAADLGTTEPPSTEELTRLRELQATLDHGQRNHG
jgi:glutaconate CoA-transferase, subunit B